MDKYIEFHHKNFFLIIIMIVVFSIISTKFILFQLDEDQILYLEATIVQSVSALYAMSLAGYSVFKSSLEKTEEFSQDPEGMSQNIKDLAREYTRHIRNIGFVTLVTVVLGVTQMILGDKRDGICNLLDKTLMNLSVLMFIFVVVEIILFVTETVNPKIIEKFGDRGQEKMQKEMNFLNAERNAEDVNNKYNTFEEFFKNYITIEEIIIKTTNEILKNHPERGGIKSMKQRIDYLKKYRENLYGLLEEINKYREYRNYLAHGTGKIKVPDNVIKRIALLKDELKKQLTKSDMYDITIGKHLEFEDFREKSHLLSIKAILSAKYIGAYKTIFRVQFNSEFESPKDCYDFLMKYESINDKLEKVKVVESPFYYPAKI